ncbi:DNA polymerase III, partial [Candidatus Peregrinibacteria bacterium CG_4_10_14_0_2_um_filter_41_8]
MLNKEIAEIFNTFADVYEILIDELQENDKQISFKIRAYRQAALTLQNLSQDLKVLNTKKHLDALPGIGAAFASKIQEYINTGKIAEFEQLKTLVPPGLLDILNIPGLGPKKVKLFYTQLGITNLEQLAKAVKEGQIEQLPRMGKKSAD